MDRVPGGGRLNRSDLKDLGIGLLLGLAVASSPLTSPYFWPSALAGLAAALIFFAVRRATRQPVSSADLSGLAIPSTEEEPVSPTRGLCQSQISVVRGKDS